MHVWRIAKQRYSNAAFSGEGARLFSGRWNAAGLRMVYCSTSLALASLEFFVHLDPSVAPDDLVSVMAELPDHLTRERIEVSVLPKNWKTLENITLQQIGSDWVESLQSVALVVPSAVVEDEWNVLLNPGHPDFARIFIHGSKPFIFDARMFAR